MAEESLIVDNSNSPIKTEPKDFLVIESDRSLDNAVQVKLELEELYGDHEIDEDMVIGPTVVSRPVTKVVEHGESSQDSDMSLAHIEKEKENNLPNKPNSLTHILQKNTTSRQRKTKDMKKNANTAKDERDLSCECGCLSRLVEHRNIHDRNKRFSCDHCGRKFRYLCSLAQHIKVHSCKKLLYVCDICKKTFKSKELLMLHQLIHTVQKPFICKVCKKPFRTLSDLKQHSSCHTDEIVEELVFDPSKLQKTYSRQNYFSEPIQDSDVTLGHIKREIKDNLRNKPNSLTVTHQMKNNPTSSRIQSKMFLEKNKLFACDTCDKIFKSKQSLLQHNCDDTRRNPYICEVCNKQFRQLRYLKHHSLIHTGERPFSCDICHKKFRRSNHLIEHKYIHTGDKPFHCEVCNRQFRNSSSLLDHKNFHEGFKGYQCDICNKYLRQRHNLKIHRLIHNRDNWDKPFSCDVCKKQYVTKKKLKQHIITIHSYKKS